MRRSDPRRWLALAFAGTLVLAACTAAASPTPAPTTAPPSTAPSTAPTPSPTPLPGTKQFTVGATLPAFGDALWMAAQDDLRSQGYTVTYSIIAATELVTDGVANGTFAFGSGNNNATMTAVDKGAPLRLIINRVSNEWTLFARTDIANCAALAGKKLAINSQGSVSTAMIKSWMAKTCPGTVPNWLIIAGSPNRLAALLANQIDASPLEIADAVTIEASAGARFHNLSNFQADLPDLQPTSIFVNTNFAKANPGTVLAVVEAVLKEFRKAAGNADYLKTVALKYVGDSVNKTYIDAIAKKYTDLKLFDVNGGLTQANLEYAAKYFGPAPDGTGATTAVLAVDKFADLSYLQMALNDLGKQ